MRYLFLYLFLLVFGACAFSNKTSTRLLLESSKKQYDIVIVPGVPFVGESWDAVMKIRVYWSKYLFDQGIAKNIMFSGSSVYSPYIEAKIMALYAEALGIPAEHIFTEERAEHSTENVYYSFKKSKKLGYHRIALASDPFQSKLVKRFTHKRVDKDIAIIPIVFDTLLAYQPIMFNPSIDFQKAYVSGFVSIVDRQSFGYRLKGTRGKLIDRAAYE